MITEPELKEPIFKMMTNCYPM